MTLHLYISLSRGSFNLRRNAKPTTTALPAMQAQWFARSWALTLCTFLLVCTLFLERFKACVLKLG